MLSTWEKILFLIVIGTTAAAFLTPLARRYRIIRAGLPDERVSGLGKRLGQMLAKVLLQRCTLKNERLFTGFMHVFIFYGALTFDTMTVNHTLEGFFAGFYIFGNTRLGLLFSLAVDVFAVLVLAATVFFAVRRFWIKPKAYATTPKDSALIYAFLWLVTLTYMYFEAFHIASHPEISRLSFLGSWLAGRIMEGGMGAAAAAAHLKAAWWLHILVVFSFIAYVPHSKYLHMFAGPLNVFFRPERPGGSLKALDLENSETFGLEKVSDFTWKDSLDAFACVECGRCQDACPAFASEKPLSPKMILFNQEQALLQNGRPLVAGKTDSLPPLVPGVFTEGEIWSCTTCGACQHVCPVEIKHIPKIVGLRRSQVLMKSAFPAELNAFFRNIETNSNPWGIGFAQRNDWAAGLDVKHISESPDAEFLLWVGCMGAFDDEGKKNARAMAGLMTKAGLTFAVLGIEEKCCGDSARRLGNEYLFQQLAMENLAVLKKYGIRKIVTICPHGFNTLRNEYADLFDSSSSVPGEDKTFYRSIEIVSHVELIARLLKEGRLRVNAEKGVQALTYHDACYLARHNGIVREPREILSRIAGRGVTELRNNGEHTFCCGGGGGLMWTEETLGRRINHLRTEDILRSGAKIAATSCPFCSTMLRDGLKDRGADDVRVLDIARLVERSLV